MKKFLSLVLALVMTMSLVTISAGGTNIVTDSKTVFVLKIGTDYKVYEGYKNAPGFSGTSNINIVSALNNDGVAVMVYAEMTPSEVSSTASDLTFIAFDKDVKVSDDGNNQYYTFNAVVDGKVTTVDVDGTVHAAILGINAGYGTGGRVIYATDAPVYDGDKIMTSAPVPGVSTKRTTGDVTPVSNEVIKLAGISYAYADDVVVYFVDRDDSTFTAGDISDIRTDDVANGKDPYGLVTYHLDSDGIIDIIILEEK